MMQPIYPIYKYSSDQQYKNLMAEQLQQSDRDEGRRVGDFVMGRTIGQGTFNKVKIARHVYSNEQVAIKLIDKQKIVSEADQKRLARQLKILRKVRHPNIVQLYQILEDTRYYYVVTEYASRGELFQHIVKNEKLTEFEASRILQQMVNAIEYLLELGVVHRDLKPENILLDYKYNVKIIDFGLSNVYSRGEQLSTACGSPSYAAPEMLSGNPYDPVKIDIWNLGIILYAMCFGMLPFDHEDSGELYRMIREGRYELPQHASEQLTDMLKLLIEVDPQKRASIEQIRHDNFCKFSPIPVVSGLIQGLSSFPVEEHIVSQIKQLSLPTQSINLVIQNNKHNSLTTTYYLLLQQWLRQRNESIVNYYSSKNNVINRYKLIEKVKENYEKRLIVRLEELDNSRRLRAKSSQKTKTNTKKRSKTTDRKYQTGAEMSKVTPKVLFGSPQRKSAWQPKQTSAKKQRQGHAKASKLKRT